ncbi:MAG TPA: M23 family metallopeptidase, partial [Fibrobacteraceae bacterium]|nr:M23 family metallopeptidase [Fibrobacteraceae bacterium]
IAHLYIKLLIWLCVVVLIFSAIIFWKLTEINAVLLTSKFLKNTNEKLVARHQEYEAAFQELDSIYSMERQIQNILQTYYSTDTVAMQSVFDKNRLKRISSSKSRLDMDRIYDYVRNENSNTDHLPNILPVIGTISKHFSEAEHPAIDFAAPLNEPVFATAYGTVIFSADESDLGLTIRIDHGSGYISSYSHLGKSFVRKGLYVKKGETIGTVGLTGNTSGPHLHYAVQKDGKPINPESYF